jgi:hypothetical protein
MFQELVTKLESIVHFTKTIQLAATCRIHKTA